MIVPKHYSHQLYRKLEEKSVGGFSISKSTIHKGSFIRTYHPAGFFYHDWLSSDLPVVKLVGDGGTLMSDTPLEQEAYKLPVSLARGDILVIGLGIGLFLQLLRERNTLVKHITIVELREEVKSLVWRKVKSSNTELIIADGKEYLKDAGRQFDYIFIDVWGSICGTLADVKSWRELAQSRLRGDNVVDFWLRALYNRVEYRLNQGPSLATSAPGPHDPCLICGKKIRFDYAGLCADCADPLGLSEYFMRKEKVAK